MKLILTITCALLMNISAAENNWVKLFNGQNLDGWTEKTKSASFHVENGTIIGTAKSGLGTTFLCSNKNYGDFELEFETIIYDSALNSGVQIRSRNRPPRGNDKYGVVYGPQVEISAKRIATNNSGHIYGQLWKGWVTPKATHKLHNFFKDKKWNHFRVVAQGDQITTWINGNKVITTTVPPERHKTNPSGLIGLQLHAIKEGTGPYLVAWRNIKIKEITTEK
ncbi:MAG: DUF1080 domain-containing protein [Lentisphaeraceae bacterium]|nr:DUF1080 domain-containing protein [Lentisphaeraceae bacterium]